MVARADLPALASALDDLEPCLGRSGPADVRSAWHLLRCELLRARGEAGHAEARRLARVRALEQADEWGDPHLREAWLRGPNVAPILAPT